MGAAFWCGYSLTLEPRIAWHTTDCTATAPATSWDDEGKILTFYLFKHTERIPHVMSIKKLSKVSWPLYLTSEFKPEV